MRTPTRTKKSLGKPNLPAKSKVQHLPFHEVGEVNFEELCRRLCEKAYPEYERYELKRLKGNQQFGIDVECFAANGDPEVVLSAKCYDSKTVRPSDIEQWVEDFAKHLDGHWKDKNIKKYVLAVTKDGNNDELNESIKIQKRILKLKNIDFVVWFNSNLQAMCKLDRVLVAEFFDPAWSARIFPEISVIYIDSTLPTAGHFGTDVIALPAPELVALREKTSKTVIEVIELHVEARRQGNSVPLVEYLGKVRRDPEEWVDLTKNVQAKVVRLLASIALENGDVGRAQALVNEAKTLAPLPDQVLPALIAYQGTGIEAALKLLEKTTSAIEGELRAAFLVDQERFECAEDILSKYPATSETFRLRSLIACKRGEYETAIAFAEEAAHTSARSFGVSLALMCAHLHCAMVSGTLVLTGGTPNLFNPALVQDTEAAQQHIVDALKIAEGLVDRCSGHQKADSESWKLALLLCVSGKQDAGFKFAEELVSRQIPDPLHIAWALMIGVELQIGRLRKCLEDEIRLERGTPTHLVVRALLSDPHSPGSVAGADLIAKYIDKFPSQREFLSQWQAQLSGRERQLRYKVMKGDLAAITEYIDVFEPNFSDPDSLLTHAEVLAAGQAWPNLNGIIENLICYPVSRLHQLAARAAFECGDYKKAVEIIDASVSLHAGKKLPTSMSILRANALDREGRQGETLEELIRLNHQAPSAEFLRDIVRRYFELGRTSDAAQYARELIKSKDSKPADLLIAAQVNIEIDPEFARQVSEQYLAQGSVDPGAIPCLMDIQARAGAFGNDIQTQFNLAAQEFFSSDAVVRFESVEDALDQIGRISDDKRQMRSEWELGRMVSHRAFCGDYQTFIQLFMAGAEGIESEIDDHHRPLLSTAGLPLRTFSIDRSKKPKLTIDISGLILAWRFKILDHLDSIFQLQLPRVTSRYLVDVLQNWRTNISVGDCQKFREFEKLQQNEIVILPLVPDSEPVLRRFYSQNERPPHVDWVLNELSESGIVSEQKLSEFISDLNIDTPIKPNFEINPQQICIDGGMLLSFIRCCIFDAIKRIVEIRITITELNNLKMLVDREESSQEIRRSIQGLHTKVSNQLVASKWFTLPSPPRADMVKDASDSFAGQNLIIGSVWESFNYSASSDKPLVWIEDRYLSRHNIPNILSFTDVINILEEYEALSKSEANEIRNQRLAAGLGFVSLDVDQFLIQVLESKEKHGQIIETESLQNIREAFGLQAALLHYVDWDENRTDADGNVIGELRHAQNTGFLLPRLLNKLWFESQFEPERLVASSDWLWINLRLESIRLSDDNLTGEQLNSMAGIVLISCVVQPFLNALIDNNKLGDKYDSYINWLFIHHLNARFTNDSALRATFVQQFVSLFTKQLDLELGDDELTNNLSNRIIAREVNRLLDLFPEYLREEILETSGFSERIYVKREFVVHSPVGDFSAENVGRAIQNALESLENTAELEMVDSATHASLIVTDRGSGGLGVQIVAADNVFSLPDYAVMLSAPRAEQRLGLFDSVVFRSGKDSQFRDAARSILSADQSLNSRLKRWNEFREMDFDEKLTELREQIRLNKRVTATFFDLPPAISLLRYSRISEGENDPASALELALSRLGLDFDSSVAHHRLAVVEVLGGLAESGGLNAWTRPDNGNVFEGVLWHSMNDGTKPEVPPSLSELREVSDKYIGFFSSLVQRGANESLIRPDYSVLPDWLVVMLLWVWAAQLTNVLVAVDADLIRLKGMLEDQERLRLDQTLQGDGISTSLRVGGIELSSAWCRQRLFALITAERTVQLDPIVDKALLTLIGKFTGETWIPEASLMFQPDTSSWPSNRLSNYEDWISLGLINPSVDLRRMGKSILPKSLLDEYESAGRRIDHLLLFTMSRPGDLNQQFLGKLANVLWGVLIESARRELETEEKILLRLFGRITGELDDDERMKCLMTAMVCMRYGHEAPPRLREVANGENECGLFELLADAVFAHVQVLQINRNDKIDRLCALLGHLYELWPRSNRSLHQVLISLVNVTPVALAKPIWRLLRRVRADVTR